MKLQEIRKSCTVLKTQGSYMSCFPCVQENPMWSATRKHMMMKS